MIDKKKCFKCGEVKPIECFYKHPKMSDGRLNKCKDCAKKDSKELYHDKMKNPEFAEKERHRSRVKSRNSNRSYTSEQVRRWNNNWKNKYPEQYAAKLACDQMERKKEELHHWSYKEEHLKDVIHMSMNNHRIAHRYIQYDQERMMYRTIEGILLDTKKTHKEYIYKKIKEDPFYNYG